MKQPKQIKLNDSPECKKVNLTPLPPINRSYPEPMSDDIYSKTTEDNIGINNENNSENHSESI
jgi:hypothetical protein